MRVLIINNIDLRLTLLQGSSQFSPTELPERPSRDPRIQLRNHTRISLAERLAGKLLYLIANGQLSPGSRLPAERQIAETMGVSRVCVRNALGKLKDKGYLKSIQGSGTRVTTSQGNSSLIRDLLSANSENLQDLAEIRGHLEVWAAARAACNANDTQLRSLRTLVNEATHLGEKERVENDLEFHIMIARASGCMVYEYLLQLLDGTLRSYFRQLRHVFSIDESTSNKLVDQHALICKAIERRDAEEAAKSMAAHTSVIRNAYSKDRGAAGPISCWQNGTLHLSKEETLKLLAETKHEQLSDHVTNSLIALLGAGRLAPGECLPGERELADRMGVSRISIRAALAQLKELGFLESTQRSGTRVVAHPNPLHSAEASIKASPSHLFDLCEIRGYLEAWAARRAAYHASEKDRDELRQIIREMHYHQASSRLTAHYDHRFHLLIAKASGSAVYFHLMSTLQDVLSDYFEYFRNHIEINNALDCLALEHHTAIQEAICRGDGDEASKWMREHSRIFQDAYRQHALSASPGAPTETQL
ncbi:FadR/GntR family transcriptional regulator [Marinobacter sp. 2_MG-2023]|uniref:FadR/GntR family transcriptional regulator n=1 Tax=Marinobacter sp. 2_MG-2023 TaxID=3062679 RepID=UPI0026E45B16|nr:FCD domain-containing protein [Marinobacter sp. 2_MG-2023]MDO6441440.1 GntR family transcriptional regulator [Marinobacter sp. 2_MG-2023]